MMSLCLAPVHTRSFSLICREIKVKSSICRGPDNGSCGLKNVVHNFGSDDTGSVVPLMNECFQIVGLETGRTDTVKPTAVPMASVTLGVAPVQGTITPLTEHISSPLTFWTMHPAGIDALGLMSRSCLPPLRKVAQSATYELQKSLSVLPGEDVGTT